MPLSKNMKIGIAAGVAAVVVILIIVLVVVFMGGGGPSGRYIYIERVSTAAPAPDYINLDDVKALDAKGNSLMTGASVTTGALLNNTTAVAPPSNLIDAATGTIAHTQLATGTDFSNQWYKIDLGSDKKIAKVVVTNRKDCCQDRAVGLQVRITNAAGKTIYTGPKITTADPVYTYIL